jgi:hypothetical protein
MWRLHPVGQLTENGATFEDRVADGRVISGDESPTCMTTSRSAHRRLASGSTYASTSSGRSSTRGVLARLRGPVRVRARDYENSERRTVKDLSYWFVT